MSGKEIQTDGL